MSSDKKKRIFGSNSGFLWGRTVFTDRKSACLRNILLAANHVKEPSIAEKYKVIGAQNEEDYEKTLTGVVYEREKPIRYAINDSVDFSGRADFVLRGNDLRVIELKATDSKRTWGDVKNHGRYKVENLAQLLAYMVALKTQIGMLVYSYYQLLEGLKYQQAKQRAFEIIVDDNGRVNVDAAPTQFHVTDLLAHQQAAAKVVIDEQVWERPYNGTLPFIGACGMCPWASSCDKFDAGEIDTARGFIEDARESLTKQRSNNDDESGNA